MASKTTISRIITKRDLERLARLEQKCERLEAELAQLLRELDRARQRRTLSIVKGGDDA